MDSFRDLPLAPLGYFVFPIPEWILANSSRNKLTDSPQHARKIIHNLFIPKADNASTGSAQVLNPYLAQNLFQPCIFFLLQIMDISIYFNDQRRFVTVKINDESLDDLLSSEMDSLACSRVILSTKSFLRKSCRVAVRGRVEVFLL